MQRPRPFQPWDHVRDNDQMRQSGIGAGLPSLTTHLHHLAAGDRGCCVQDGDCCSLQDMGEALANRGNRIYNAWEIRPGAWFFGARFHNVKYYAKATGLTRVHDGQVHTLEPAIF